MELELGNYCLFVSVIIPVREISDYLRFEGFPAFDKQTYKKFEVIVVCDSVGVYNYKPLQNEVAFCGPGVLPKNASFLEKVFDAVLTSKFGSGNFTYRFQKERARFVDDYPLMNFAIEKAVFKKLKGLQNHWPGEDSKLCEELVKHGYKIRYSPDLVVFHHRKKNLTDFLLQHSRYGFKRGLFFAEGDKNSRKVIYVSPVFFLIYLLVLPFELYFVDNQIFLIPFFLYFFCLLLFFGFLILKRRGLVLSFFSAITLMLMHLIYAIYFIWGFLIKFFRLRFLFFS